MKNIYRIAYIYAFVNIYNQGMLMYSVVSTINNLTNVLTF